MIDDSAPRAPDPIEEWLPAESLDVAQAEGWASGVVAVAASLEDAIDALERHQSAAALAVLGGLSAVAAAPGRARARAALERLHTAGVPGPPWLAAAGTAKAVDAHVVSHEEVDVLVIGWRHDDDTRHCLLLDLAGDRISAVRLGEAEVIPAADEPGMEDVVVAPVELEAVRSRIAAALGRPIVGDEETWLNAAVAQARFESLGIERTAEFTPPATAHPGPERDEDGARLVLDLLPRALRDRWSAGASGDSSALVEEAAALIRPTEIVGLAADEAEAVVHLEWADWIGAVLGLVRGGPGTAAMPDDLVRLINRCPEVTTTIPPNEAAAIAACFAVATTPWIEAGLIVDGRLAEAGARLLPDAVLLAARRELAADGP